MPRLYPCRSFAQAHIIRGFFNTHDVEAHVLHENAATFWCTSGPGCVLAIHETDLEFLPEILSAPRESLTDDEDIPSGDFSESGQGPMRYDSGFFLGMVLVRTAIVLGFCILCLGLHSIDLFLTGQLRDISEPVYSQIGFGMADVVAAIKAGMIGGLLAGVAIITARQFRPDATGIIPYILRCLLLIYLCLSPPIVYVVWLLYLLKTYFYPASPDYD